MGQANNLSAPRSLDIPEHVWTIIIEQLLELLRIKKELSKTDIMEQYVPPGEWHRIVSLRLVSRAVNFAVTPIVFHRLTLRDSPFRLSANHELPPSDAPLLIKTFVKHLVLTEKDNSSNFSWEGIDKLVSDCKHLKTLSFPLVFENLLFPSAEAEIACNAVDGFFRNNRSASMMLIKITESGFTLSTTTKFQKSKVPYAMVADTAILKSRGLLKEPRCGDKLDDVGNRSLSLVCYYSTCGWRLEEHPSRILWMKKFPPMKHLICQLGSDWNYSPMLVLQIWDFSQLQDLTLRGNILASFAKSVGLEKLSSLLSLTVLECRGYETIEAENGLEQLLRQITDNRGLLQLGLVGEWRTIFTVSKLLSYGSKLVVLNLLNERQPEETNPFNIEQLEQIGMYASQLRELAIDVEFGHRRHVDATVFFDILTGSIFKHLQYLELNFRHGIYYVFESAKLSHSTTTDTGYDGARMLFDRLFLSKIEDQFLEILIYIDYGIRNVPDGWVTSEHNDEACSSEKWTGLRRWKATRNLSTGEIVMVGDARINK